MWAPSNPCTPNTYRTNHAIPGKETEPGFLKTRRWLGRSSPEWNAMQWLRPWLGDKRVWWPEELKEGGKCMDGLNENIFFYVRGKKKSPIKCQIKTEGGCLRKAEACGWRGACEPLRMLEWIYANQWQSEGWPWMVRASRGNKDGRTRSAKRDLKNKMSQAGSRTELENHWEELRSGVFCLDWSWNWNWNLVISFPTWSK